MTNEAVNTCEMCGGSPAAPIKLSRQVGLVLVQKVYKGEMMLCNECGADATKEFQKQTALKGWTSPRSAVMNPFTMAANVKRRRKHRKSFE